jgi:hypothetical protein
MRDRIWIFRGDKMKRPLYKRPRIKLLLSNHNWASVSLEDTTVMVSIPYDLCIPLFVSCTTALRSFAHPEAFDPYYLSLVEPWVFIWD